MNPCRSDKRTPNAPGTPSGPYSICMNETKNDLRSRCLARAEELSDEINGNLFYVPDEDIESCLVHLTESSLEDIASELASLAAWFN